MIRILIVDDHRNTTEAIQQITEAKGYEGFVAHDAESAFDIFKSTKLDLIITDMKMPGMTGLGLLKKVREIDAQVPVIVVTAFGTVDNAVEAMKLGAFDYISKPFSIDEIEIKIEKALKIAALQAEHERLQWENRYLREEVHTEFSEIIGQTPAMQHIYQLIQKVSSANSPILILGESGTGKELIARAIHHSGSRNSQPFIKINCAALAEGILESELFGHERGAFTGAIRRKPGRFEIAGSGTVFLDEIGEISPALQGKLLRVLQEKEFERVGGIETLKMEARVLAATNQRLPELINEKKFREDLYYRLNVVSIHLPPLRERVEDIPLLATHFVKKYRFESGRDVKRIQPAAMKHLLRYSWPGNIRELENVIERAVVLTNSTQVEVVDLPAGVRKGQENSLPGVAGSGQSRLKLNERLDEYEKHLIFNALNAAKGNMTQAAHELGLNRTTLRYKMQKHGFLGQTFE